MDIQGWIVLVLAALAALFLARQVLGAVSSGEGPSHCSGCASASSCGIAEMKKRKQCAEGSTTRLRE